MKLQVTQEKLNHALSIVSRVAASRTALPILSNILITADKNRLTIAATNLEIAISYSVSCKVDETGSLTVPARLMHDFVASLPDSKITLEQDGQSLKVKAEKYNSTINGVTAEEFPSLPKLNKAKPQTISALELKTALQQTVFAASSDEARQVLTGVYMHTHNKKLYFVATDSYRLAEKQVAKQEGSVSLVVPASALQELLRILDNETESVQYSFDDGQVMFKIGDIEIISRLVDGNFPDYRQLIPKNNDIKVDIKKDDFINITKVSSLFARESAGSITLHVSEDDQEVSIRSIASQVGENTSRASAKVSGSGEVTLNSRYLLDALNAFGGENVHLEFSGKINPCVITDADKKNSDYLHIVMPLRS